MTDIVHNAWMVHFKHPLSSFENQIAGTRKLIDFCMALDRPVKLLFTSSVAVAQRWDASNGAVPEEPLDDPDLTTPSGYGASKYVTEQVKRTPLYYLVCRFDLLCNSCLPELRAMASPLPR